MARPKKTAPRPIACFCSDPHVGNHGRNGGPVVDGLNRRGRETIDVLRRAVAAAVEREARAFVVCGDLFQTARPEPAVIRAVQDVFAAAREHLCVVLIPGNHDMPDASTAGGNTAMAPLQEQVTFIANHPGLNLGPALPILCVPFDGTAPMAKRLCDVLASPPDKDSAVLATHVGVWDEADAAPWMRKARDGISTDLLFACMRQAELAWAFVGNYHAHRVWTREDAGGPRTIVQVGTLCPASHSDGGLVDRGLVAFLEAGGKWSKQEIPGPRFVTLDADKGEELGPAPAGFSYYVRERGKGLNREATAEAAGWTALDQDGPPDVAGDFEPVALEETDEEAIVAAAAEVDLPALVSRDAVRDLALLCWSKS